MVFSRKLEDIWRLLKFWSPLCHPVVDPRPALSLGWSTDISAHLLFSLMDSEASLLRESSAPMSVNGDMASIPLENIKLPKKLDLGTKMLHCCLWPFSYLYKGGACLGDKTLPKCKFHKNPCQKLKGP